MVCSRCKWFYKPVSEEKKRHCQNCTLSDKPYNDGRVFVSLDSSEEARAHIERQCCHDPRDLPEQEQPEYDLESYNAGIAAGRLDCILALKAIPDDFREMIFARLNGTLTAYARKHGMTRQGISARWRSWVRQFPNFRDVFANPRHSNNATLRAREAEAEKDEALSLGCQLTLEI